MIYGAVLSLLGTAWGFYVLRFVENHLAQAWNDPLGRFLTSVGETGMTLPLILCAALLMGGLIAMTLEAFKKD